MGIPTICVFVITGFFRILVTSTARLAILRWILRPL